MKNIFPSFSRTRQIICIISYTPNWFPENKLIYNNFTIRQVQNVSSILVLQTAIILCYKTWIEQTITHTGTLSLPQIHTQFSILYTFFHLMLSHCIMYIYNVLFILFFAELFSIRHYNVQYVTRPVKWGGKGSFKESAEMSLSILYLVLNYQDKSVHVYF